MDKDVRQRLFFGSLATFVLLLFAGFFVFLAFYSPINDLGQNVFWPELGASLLFFLPALVFFIKVKNLWVKSNKK